MSETKRGIGSQVTVRFPPAEAAVLRRLAEARGQSAGEVIREAVRRMDAGAETITITLDGTALASAALPIYAATSLRLAATKPTTAL